MSIRITSRSRPRMDKYPWPMRTRQVTLAQINEDREVPGLIGPLPMIAVMELMYRVRKLRYQGSAEVDDGITQEQLTIDLTTDYPGGTDELALWAALHYNLADVESLEAFASNDDGFAYARAISTSLGQQNMHPEAEVFQDENGDYWLSGLLGCQIGFDIFTFPSVVLSTNDDGGTFQTFTALLKLQTGDYNLSAIATTLSAPDINDPALTITATEWFPYKTTAGLAAWDTATGAIANGGPGA